VVTDEVYYATENGQILDLDYHEMNSFRDTTLHSLLIQATSIVGRMGRPNNAIERSRRFAGRDRNYSLVRGHTSDRNSQLGIDNRSS